MYYRGIPLHETSASPKNAKVCESLDIAYLDFDDLYILGIRMNRCQITPYDNMSSSSGQLEA